VRKGDSAPLVGASRIAELFFLSAASSPHRTGLPERAIEQAPRGAVRSPLGDTVRRSKRRGSADVSPEASGLPSSCPAMKSWVQRERARAILQKEVGYFSKPHGNRLRIALAFPNSYWVGMSNLGLQTVYRLFNAHDDIVCERFFLPPKQELAELLRAK